MVMRIAEIFGDDIFASQRKSGPRNTIVTSDSRPEVEIRPFRACAMHPAIVIRTVRLLWTWLLGRYHVPQNAFLVLDVTRLYIINMISNVRFIGEGLTPTAGRPTLTGDCKVWCMGLDSTTSERSKIQICC